jgi:hypothetical protein
MGGGFALALAGTGDYAMSGVTTARSQVANTSTNGGASRERAVVGRTPLTASSANS